ncbi:MULTISPECIES: hypothetical protein [unclassified Streptomyces]|nr:MULTISPECIES: hypothetical protein [unclassified Streptomyces]MCX4882860.1 hypothetical protein [Streptomyces sp. NBC_00847]MCX5422907.1 hypothetical protein [Streptomyces sp. NBC_00078]
MARSRAVGRVFIEALIVWGMLARGLAGDADGDSIPGRSRPNSGT